MSYTLYGQSGFGSVCVEAALELLGLDYEFVEADPLGDEANRRRVTAINPVGQVPALILPDGSPMTESAAILTYLGDLHPGAGLVPAPDAPERAQYLRWMSFLSASIYSTFTLSDDPSRYHPDPEVQEALRHSANERRKAMWTIMNEAFEGHAGPCLLGANMSFLDVYVAMMSFWSPRRDWFEANCPHLAGAVHALERNPVIKRVWARNYDAEALA
jgi:GST-like protein